MVQRAAGIHGSFRSDRESVGEQRRDEARAQRERDADALGEITGHRRGADRALFVELAFHDDDVRLESRGADRVRRCTITHVGSGVYAVHDRVRSRYSAQGSEEQDPKQEDPTRPGTIPTRHTAPRCGARVRDAVRGLR